MTTKYLITILTLLGLVACHSPQPQGVEEDKPFDITFDVEQEENDAASFTFAIALDTGYYIVSPYSTGHHQRLIFSIEDTDNLLLNGELIEAPLAIQEYDQLSDKEGKFVRKNTTYTQHLTIGSHDDFEVAGLIWLELRPDCLPYEVRFTISNKAGKLIVKQTSISLADYPTFWDKKRVDMPLNESN